MANLPGARKHIGAISPPRPVLLFVVNAAWFFLSHRLPIARAAVQAGFQVHLAAADATDAEVAELRANEIVFHGLPMERGRLAASRDLSTLLELARLFRLIRPAIVHAVTAKAIIFSGLLAWLRPPLAVVNAVSGLGYVFSSRDWRATMLRWPVRLAYRMAFARRMSFQIFQNPADRVALLGSSTWGPRDVFIAGSGVDVDQYRVTAEPDGAPTVLLPARMLRDKGIVEFCEAAKLLRSQSVNARFVLAGRLDYGNPSSIRIEELSELCRQSGVTWLGHQRDIPALMASSTLVCLPSYREGLPKALIEACAAGRAIVTTDVPGCRDVVSHGLNGLLVPPRDARSLAEALRHLLHAPDLRVAFGAAGRIRAEREFDVRVVTARTLQLYAGLLAGSAG